MRKVAFLALAVLTLGGTRAGAQTVTATVTIPQVLYIELDNSAVSFTAAANAYETVDDITIAGSNPTVVTTRANVSHDLQVTADATDFAFVPLGSDADPGKDASDLQWTLQGAGNWAGLNTTAAVVEALERGRNIRTVEYRLLSRLADDPPGTYTLQFTYTLLAN